MILRLSYSGQLEKLDRLLKSPSHDRATGVRTWRVAAAVSEHSRQKFLPTVTIQSSKSVTTSPGIDCPAIVPSLVQQELLRNRRPAEQKH